jgi:HSP20 family protein
MKDNRSFFDKLTGNRDEEEEEVRVSRAGDSITGDDEAEEGQLTVDMYQAPSEIVIKSMVAGVKPEDLDVSITRDMVTIKGKRETEKFVKDDDYYHQELYWGTFSRTIMLPSEIIPDEAEAIEKHGLLIIRLPKIDKNRSTKLRVKG